MRYHPRIGFTYMPSTKLRVQGVNGGYLVRTNATGFRSDREFKAERTPGAFRALLFGDSQTAGDGMANAQRYSDLLEKAVPGLEIYNYGVSGTGTDQQYLVYQDFGTVDHDLVVLGLFVENIRRLVPRVLRSRDITGEEALRGKPYYELGPDGLSLKNVPVPKQAWTEETLPKDLLPYVYTYGNEYSVFRDPTQGHASLLRRLVPAGPLRDAAKAVLSRIREYQPIPEYNSRTTPEWLLLRELLTAWIRGSKAPMLLVLLPHETALEDEGSPRRSDPGQYQSRFRELAEETGCHVYDPLPELREMNKEVRSGFTVHGHLSTQGHETIAKLLQPVFQKLTAGRVASSATGAA